MGIFQNDAPPPLYVPDLTKPAGATVDVDGNVTCVTCGSKLPVARADVVGQGYRCPACSAKAEIAALTGGPSDVSANLSASDRKALRLSGWKLIGPGVLAIIAGGVLIPFAGPRLCGSLIFGGGGSCALGLMRMRAAR